MVNDIISPDGSVTPEPEEEPENKIYLKNPKIFQFLKIVFPLLKKYWLQTMVRTNLNEHSHMLFRYPIRPGRVGHFTYIGRR